MSAAEEAARAALRARQGSGARYDAPAAPAGDLLLARRGTAFFARKLNELTDEDLDGPSRVPGWSRRRVIAFIGYQARTQALALMALREGRSGEEPEGLPELSLAETLPPHALRYLFRHSEVHLNVEWRDLPDEGWKEAVSLPGGMEVPVRDLPLMRAREIWKSAVDLGNGARVEDIPAAVRMG